MGELSVNHQLVRSNRTTLVVFLILLILLLCLCLWMIASYLLAIATGGILALMTKPLFHRLIARKFSPKVSSALVTLGIILLVIVPASVCIGLAVKQAVTISHVVASSEVYSFRSIIEKLTAWVPFEIMGLSPEEVDAKARDWIQSGISTSTTAIVSMASYVPNIFLQLALASIQRLLKDAFKPWRPRLKGEFYFRISS